MWSGVWWGSGWSGLLGDTRAPPIEPGAQGPEEGQAGSPLGPSHRYGFFLPLPAVQFSWRLCPVYNWSQREQPLLPGALRRGCRGTGKDLEM